MALGTDPPYDYLGYGIRIQQSVVSFYKQDGDWSTSQVLASVTFEDFADTWTHFDVTRNITSGFNIYINATSSIAEPDISWVDSGCTISERFVIDCHGGSGVRFDNFTFNSDILITPLVPTTSDTTTPSDTTTTNGGTTPPPIDTTLLIVGAGVTGMVIVAAVVFMRRR